MVVPSKVNKENFRLLDLSSDEESDLQLEIIPNKKKKISRRERSRGTSSRLPEPNIGSEVKCAIHWALRGTLILWLLMLTWICAALYDQVTTMKTDIVRVTTSSDSVGDALQVCHTAAKELRANATDLNARLAKLELDHQELERRVEKAAVELASVSEQLSNAPKLADTPKRLVELQRTVGEFGSQIKSLEAAMTSVRNQANTAASGVEDVKTLVHQLDERSNVTIANVTDNVKRDEELKQQVVALNTTLVARVDSIEARIEERNKPSSTVTPSSTSTSTSSTTPQTTTSTTTVLPNLPPVPVKQSVLH